MANESSLVNQILNQTSKNSLLSGSFLRAIKPGHHTGKIIKWEDGISNRTGEPYISVTFRVDDEPANRTQIFFEKTVRLMLEGLLEQFTTLSDAATGVQIMNLAKTTEFNFWIVQQDSYLNWWFKEPRLAKDGEEQTSFVAEE